MTDVTCAIIFFGKKILATRRARGLHLEGLWEFPGGKIEPGENAEECIVREIREELNIEINILKSLSSIEHHYPEKSIRLIPFLCEITSGNLLLTEHSEFRWLTKEEIDSMNWAAADRELIHLNLTAIVSL